MPPPPGCLRSGRLSHRRGAAAEALDIDLSSTRTRDALAVLDGMRRGQTLGALLGYRLERRLHERSGSGPDRARSSTASSTCCGPSRRCGSASSPSPRRRPRRAWRRTTSSTGCCCWSVGRPARSTWRRRWRRRQRTTTTTSARRGFQPTPDELTAVREEIEALERTHDAVADLLLAESVHQLVGGNPTRAASVLDVLGAGEAVPPDPEVVSMPRSGVPIEHRLAIVLPDPSPAGLSGWRTDTPRALAEPRLEVWAEHALGPADELPIDAGHALSEAGLSALDVVYDADGDSARAQHAGGACAGGDSRGRARAATSPSCGSRGRSPGRSGRCWLRGARSAGRTSAGPSRSTCRVSPTMPTIGRLPDCGEILDRAAAAANGLRAAAAIGLPTEAQPEPGSPGRAARARTLRRAPTASDRWSVRARRSSASVPPPSWPTRSVGRQRRSGCCSRPRPRERLHADAGGPSRAGPAGAVHRVRVRVPRRSRAPAAASAGG